MDFTGPIAEAAARLERDGPNATPPPPAHLALHEFFALAYFVIGLEKRRDAAHFVVAERRALPAAGGFAFVQLFGLLAVAFGVGRCFVMDGAFLRGEIQRALRV